ncbi:MAG: response regulator [Anaerocolumna sp.]
MKKVMIVDDNHISVEGIWKNIDWTSLGAEVVEMQYDGAAALEVLDSTPIDLIISDIVMPGFTGLDLASKALKKNPLIKIILISAFDKFEYAKQALRIGAYDYVEKPLDYDYLVDKVRNAINLIEKEQINIEILENSRPAMIDSFFASLIHSYSDEARYNLSNYPNYLQLDLKCHFYVVIAIDIENAAAVKSSLGIQKYHLELTNLHNYLNELLGSLNLHYILNDLHGLTCILGHNYSNQVYFQKMLYNIITEVEQHYQENLLSINMGIGNVIKYLWDMNLSYNSARRALEFRFFFPQQHIFDARDTMGSNLSATLFSNDKEEQLIKLICKKDTKEISKWIKLFSEELLENYQTKNLLFIRIYSVLGRILKFLYEMDINSTDIEKDIIQVYSKLESYTTSEEIFRWLDGICQNVCTKLSDSVQTYHKQVCDSVLDYIKHHYANNGLCLNDIADSVNVSPSHLSVLYKKGTGQNISDTITSVRIDAACQLLLHSVLPLKDISEKIGYTNQYYFSSCFKKKMGQTPSEYRNRIKP